MEHAEYDKMDAVEDRMWWYRAMHAHALRALDGLPADAAILDAGCGTGGFLLKLRRAFPAAHLAGLEYFPEAARRAANKARAQVTSGTINALPFPDRRFDAVVSLDVLCHRAVEPAEALAELHRVLKPGGRLLLNLPAHEWLRSAHDIRVHTARRFDRRGAAALLGQAGFEAVEARHWNSLLLPLMLVQRKVLARKDDAASDVQEFPPWLDAALHAATRVEARLISAGLRFPAGGSLLATATRP
ncbi:MAG: class I SAM-dependent methyltransferase [Acetobacteraceae bacterium]|nr:class I SAM-dependent methyltransferase [Acetobacteraceae bacterium]